jgi:predicted RNase H-like HicB family nuclease
MANGIALIHKESDSDFGVSFPDFPGCVTAGRTIDEAKDMAREALSGHVRVMTEKERFTFLRMASISLST